LWLCIFVDRATISNMPECESLLLFQATIQEYPVGP
jgi:hypothetical protein